MNRWILIILVCLVVVQIEMLAILSLHWLNRGIWKAQIGLNELVVESITSSCYETQKE